MTDPILVVYDCMILLQAAAQPERVHGTLRLVREGKVTLMMSPAVVSEIRDVLRRPELRTKFPTLEPEHVDVFLNDMLAFARIVSDPPSHFALPRDPKDEPYINLAIEVNAGYLVTWNDRHLTYLMRRDTPEGVEFCQRFPNLTILEPPTFLSKIQSPKG